MPEALLEAVLGLRSPATTNRAPADADHRLVRTLLGHVDPDSALVNDEIFGPVAPIVTFTTDDEVLGHANRSMMGLAGYVHTGNMDRALRMAERLEVGMVGINSATISNAAVPFGGVKHSGLGREGGNEGIKEYLETVYVGFEDPFTHG